MLPSDVTLPEDDAPAVVTAVYFRRTGEIDGRPIGHVGMFFNDAEAPGWVATDWDYRDAAAEEMAELYGVEIVDG
jgi:hypothetical protein